MKVYPKIPRYDHPVVPDSFFQADDLPLVEKFDGSSFRFTLYDERYPAQVKAAALGTGAWFSVPERRSEALTRTISILSMARSTGRFGVCERGSIRLCFADSKTSTARH